MIVEAACFATQRAAPGARRAGLAYEQAALVGRFLRCRSAWAAHLARCRGFILRCAEAVPQRRRVVVLGSGPLLDIPLARLSALFSEVVLIDAVHPLHARWFARRLGNVDARCASLVAFDTPTPVYRSWRRVVPDADLVVASMLISQLPLLRVVHASKENQTWRRHLIAAALGDLLDGSQPSCLITETSRVFPEGGTEVEDPLLGNAPPPSLEVWTWVLSPPGERPQGAVSLTVSASFQTGSMPSMTKPWSSG
jgi:hypothetical protein